MINKLQSIGLTSSEAAVYLYLLEVGRSSPVQIAKATEIQRTNVYPLLRSLQDKSLISTQKVGTRKTYVADDPRVLSRVLERRHDLAQQSVADLRALYKEGQNKPQVRFFDGFEEVKQIYEMTLSAERGKLLGLGSINRLSELDPLFFRSYMERVAKQRIVFEDILPSSSRMSAKEVRSTLKGLYEVSFLPKKMEDLFTDVLVWDNHVALITLSEPVFGTLLTNASLADTFRIIFGMMRGALVGSDG